jgi:hypothetical protein
MDKASIYFARTSSPKSGLCNQLFNLITSMILAVKKSKTKLIVKDFLIDFSSSEYVPLSSIIDYEEFNIFLIKNYNIELVRQSDINIDITDIEYIYDFKWINLLNRKMFDEIIKNITFNKKYYDLSNDFFMNNNIELSKKINVLHLRLEDDAIEHWSKYHNMYFQKDWMDKESFKTIVANKYIDAIKNHLSIEDELIVLSYSTSNLVIDYLNTHGYKYYLREKDITMGREINGIIDLLIGSTCNNVFIGNFNLQVVRGSSFSYYLIQNVAPSVKKVLLDLDQIRKDLHISP